MLIASNQNKQYKWLKSLTKKKYRERENVLLIEGRRMVQHALEVGIKPKLIAVSEAHQDEYADFSVDFVFKGDLFESITDTVNSQGILAVLELSVIEQLEKPEGRHVVVCDNIQDPGNLGTIIRTCDALGIYEVYLTKGCVDPYSAKVLRSTMGSLFKVSIFKNWDAVELMNLLHEHEYHLVATALKNSVSIVDFKPEDPVAIVFGNEGNGVSEEVLDLIDTAVHIPMVGSAESLNVGVAAGIALYHLNTYCAGKPTVL